MEDATSEKVPLGRQPPSAKKNNVAVADDGQPASDGDL
jgi:hypothetical protein